MLQIPTDNFYKFVSLSSLMLFCIFFFSPFYFGLQIEIKIIEAKATSQSTEKQIESMKSVLQLANGMAVYLTTIIQSNANSFDFLYNDLESLAAANNLKDENVQKIKNKRENLLNKSAENFDRVIQATDLMLKIAEANSKISGLNSELARTKQEIELYKSKLSQLKSVQKPVSSFFCIVSFIGFWFWCKWQRKYDKFSFEM